MLIRIFETVVTKLAALKRRLRLALPHTHPTDLSADEILLVRADKRTRRRVVFIQKLPMRILMLIPPGIIVFSSNKAVLMVMLLLVLTVYVPLISLVGVYVTAKADSYDS